MNKKNHKIKEEGTGEKCSAQNRGTIVLNTIAGLTLLLEELHHGVSHSLTNVHVGFSIAIVVTS